MFLKTKITLSSIRKKLTSNAILVFYGLIMLEGILMATPFGLFLYSFYEPFLEGVQQSVLTAWIAAFFFRHVVIETNHLLLELKCTPSHEQYAQYERENLGVRIGSSQSCFCKNG